MRARKIQKTIQTYLFSIGSIYLFAFVSLLVQIPGLYGNNGLLPVERALPEHEGNLSLAEYIEALKSFPSLLIYHDVIGLSPEHMMELLCIIGAVLSVGTMVFTAVRCSLVFLVLWALYLSVYKVGQTFLHFQWDVLLLETGIITVLVAPLNVRFWQRPIPRPHDVSSLWLVRWLLFRLMFASGVVKLTSRCPTWWGLTALDWHYESQCIPTPLAWYAHQLPDWFQKLCVIGTYYIEILVPFLFFLPVRSLRLFSFWSQVFFQLCIILTGNYNFFNLLTIALCVSLLDDDFLTLKKKKKVALDWTRTTTNSIFGKRFGKLIHGFIRLIIFTSVVIGMGVACWQYFGMKMEGYRVLSETAFTVEEFTIALSRAVKVAVVMGGVSLLIELIYSVWDSVGMLGFTNKIWSMLLSVIIGASVVGMFAISLVTLGALDRSLHSNLPKEVIHLHNVFDPYEFTNPYGLFRRMTGVGGRPELIIEGTNDLDNGPWKEYDFLYKPGSIDTPPPYVFPHQPRLDWQMWFAALDSYHNNPWLVHLIYKLLQGQEEVQQLLAPLPFDTPPQYIRVGFYIYHYTSYDNTKPFYNQSLSSWWSREYEREYLFTLSADHNGLLTYLKQNGFNSESINTKHSSDNLTLSSLIDVIMSSIRVMLPHQLLWTLFVTVSLICLTKYFILSQVESIKYEDKRHKTKEVPKPTTNIVSNTITAATTANGAGKAQKKKKSVSKKKN